MMRLLVGTKKHLDFEHPIEVTEEQKEKLIELLGRIFEVVEFENVNAFNRKRLGQQKTFPCEWTANETYQLCLPTKTSEEISLATGRSWFAIDHRRGAVNYDISKWAKDSGIDITTGFTPEIIEKYMTEKVLAKKEAEVQKKKEKVKEKKIEELKEHYYHWGTTKKKEMIQWGMNLGQLPKGDVDEYIKEKRDKILKEIKELGGDIK